MYICSCVNENKVRKYSQPHNGEGNEMVSRSWSAAENRDKSLGIGLLFQDWASMWSQEPWTYSPPTRGGRINSAGPQQQVSGNMLFTQHRKYRYSPKKTLNPYPVPYVGMKFRITPSTWRPLDKVIHINFIHNSESHRAKVITKLPCRERHFWENTPWKMNSPTRFPPEG